MEVFLKALFKRRKNFAQKLDKNFFYKKIAIKKNYGKKWQKKSLEDFDHIHTRPSLCMFDDA